VKIFRSPAAAQRACRVAGRPVVFVPTMGALHAGHEALVRRARRLAGASGTVVVSIFVNPTQFGPKEDLAAYPRPWRQDLALCRSAGADAIFAPEVAAMYHADRSITVEENALSRVLCGQSRPGHFQGVCTVVAKLFHAVLPDVAIFGEKDWQQLAIIRRMVRDLDFPVRIVGHPTVREPDGLAKSSRNAYLTAEERQVAPGIYAALQAASAHRTPAAIMGAARRDIAALPGARIDYIEVVDAETLRPVTTLRRPARLAVAVFLGRARLIDNIPVGPRS
jgi:pantoate--beta-alanine ligase